MNILSIDQSTKKVGWAWFQNGILVSSGNDTLVPEDDLSSWIENMKLYTLEHIWNKEPVLIATEDPMSLSRVNPKICFKLCMSLSGIVMACKERWVQLELLSPSTIKKCISGKGNANKDMVREAVSSKLWREIESEDEADAIAIGYTILSKIDPEIQNQNALAQVSIKSI